MAAFDYIEHHCSSDDVVLATQPIAAMIPGRTGRTVFSGHWAQTMNYRAKYAFVLRLLSGTGGESKESVVATLHENRVRLLVLDRLGREGLATASTPPALQGLATLVFENNLVKIWSVPPRDAHLDTVTGNPIRLDSKAQ